MPVHWPCAALVDAQRRVIYQEIHDQLNGACTMGSQTPGRAEVTAEGLDVALEASHPHAQLDGLALHAAMRPTKVSPS